MTSSDRQLVENTEGVIAVDECGEDERVEHVPGAGAGHLGATALGDDHQALFLESFDRLADDRAADAEVFAERPLGWHQLVLGDLARDDELDQLAHDRHAQPIGSAARGNGEHVRSSRHGCTLLSDHRRPSILIPSSVLVRR
jgi:hypothetical protein